MIDVIIEIIKHLISKHYSLLGHIDLDRICFEEIDSETKPPLALFGINKNAIKLMNEERVDKRYTIYINSNCADLDKNVIGWILMELLLGIHADCDGKIRGYDFQSFAPIVNMISVYQLGADWLTNPDLPDLFKEDETYVEIF